MRVGLLFEAAIEQMVDAAVLDHDLRAEHADGIACGVADLAVADRDVVRGHLDDVSVRAVRIDERVRLNTRLGDVQTRHRLWIRERADHAMRANGLRRIGCGQRCGPGKRKHEERVFHAAKEDVFMQFFLEYNPLQAAFSLDDRGLVPFYNKGFRVGGKGARVIF
jgi:hypothetical protein